jgi:hypothetical protein
MCMDSHFGLCVCVFVFFLSVSHLLCNDHKFKSLTNVCVCGLCED